MPIRCRVHKMHPAPLAPQNTTDVPERAAVTPRADVARPNISASALPTSPTQRLSLRGRRVTHPYKTTARRSVVRVSVAIAAGTALAVGTSLIAISVASAAPARSTSSVTHPYSPAYQHPYRHGVAP